MLQAENQELYFHLVIYFHLNGRVYGWAACYFNLGETWHGIPGRYVAVGVLFNPKEVDFQN